MLQEEIVEALSSEDPELRRRGVQLVPEAPESEHARLLLRGLGDDDWRVRKEAIAIALELGPSSEMVAMLVDAFRPGDNVGLRNAAVETLAAFGGKAISAIAEALPHLDPDGRKLAAEALGRAHHASALPVLEELVSDVDPNVRVAAVDHVAEAGGLARERAISVLSLALIDSDLHVRLAALSGLQRLRATIPWEKLESLSQHPILRASALALAGRSGDSRAALSLFAALDDEQRSIYAVAVSGLAELVLTGQVSVSALRERLAAMGTRASERLLEDVLAEGKEHRAALIVAAMAREERAIDPALDAFLGERSSREAEVALRIFGSRALPRIVARIGEGRDEARAALVSLVVSLLPHEGDEAVSQALRRAIFDESPEVASSALIALATLGGEADLATVASLVSSKLPRVSVAAEAALASLAVRHPQAARAFARDALADKPLAIAVAIGALGGGLLGTVADDIAFLARAFESPDARARRAAVVAVGDVGSSLGLDLATRALDDASAEVRLAAVASLGQLRNEDGSPAGSLRLVELLRAESDVEIVAACLRALGTTGDASTLPLLTSLAVSPSTAVAVASITALARIDASFGLEAFLEAARSPEAEVVKAALLALEGSFDTRALASFRAALEHEAWDVRTLAADCLGPSGFAEAEAWLEERLSRETEPVVREALDRAIEIAAARARLADDL